MWTTCRWANSDIGRQTYIFKKPIPQVLEGDNLVTANTFYIRDEHKSVELYTSTREEKEQWLEQLFMAVKSLYTRKSSLRVGREILRPLDSEIGKRPPHMQRVETVARCTDCATHFSILRHKHNCRWISREYIEALFSSDDHLGFAERSSVGSARRLVNRCLGRRTGRRGCVVPVFR